MKLVLMAVIAAGTLVAAAAPADARQGCGRGFHRGAYGRCLPNFGPRGVIVGRYYHGRGYWDGHRYWQNRYRHHGGWRYR